MSFIYVLHSLFTVIDFNIYAHTLVPLWTSLNGHCLLNSVPHEREDLNLFTPFRNSVPFGARPSDVIHPRGIGIHITSVQLRCSMVHVRVRLRFDSSPVNYAKKCWFVFDADQCSLVRDVAYLIARQFDLNQGLQVGPPHRLCQACQSRLLISVFTVLLF